MFDGQVFSDKRQFPSVQQGERPINNRASSANVQKNSQILWISQCCAISWLLFLHIWKYYILMFYTQILIRKFEFHSWKNTRKKFLCVENNYSFALYYASQDKFDVNLWRFNIYTLVCWELLRWDRKICWKGRFAICVFGSRKMLSDFLIILSRIRLSSLPTYLAM